MENSNNATMQNVYSVGVGGNTDLTRGPNAYNKSSKKIYNNYYFADEIFTSELETKGNMLSLWDATFQNQLINEDGAFIVDELVNEGYYPQINMPDVMPMQDYIELPEVDDADLPDILSTKVLEQGTDTVKVQFSVNNPSSEQISEIKIENLDVEILSQEYSNGKSAVIAELKNPVICVSNYDLISLSTKGAFNSSYIRPYEEGERVISVDLYREIWSVNDWKAINDSPTENYMLMEDLNFINEANTIGINTVDGIINGNEHTISNINLTNDISLIGNLNGTLNNLFISNFNQEAETYGGLVATSGEGSRVDNVHVSNVNINKTGSGYVGGIVRYAVTNSVRNCSVNDLKVKVSIEGTPSSMVIGGIVGYGEYSTIENCYTYKIDISDKKGVSSGIGGIVGRVSSEASSIKNCYSEGKISSENNNVGGIVGETTKVNIENCYSKVNITTTSSDVGGILGLYSGDDLSTISNNLSIGNLFSTSGLNVINRIVGNEEDTANNNYAYENQMLNGYTNAEEKGATLLDKVEILNLSLGESYNYDGKSKEVLPKLYNTEGTELLPNQTDILIDSGSEEVNLKIESIEATKPNSTEAEITIRINNPNELEITGIEIEDMTIASIIRNVTQNGTTSITVRTTPTRYYDSYILTGIVYKNEESSEEQIKEVENEIEVQFYKEIYTYEDWQSIEEGTYQNYRLMADIDFSGKDNVKNNITVNRLEAENNIYTLKNIELTYNAANTGFINNVKESIRNIGFENITLTNTAGSGNYFGIISSNDGIIENLRFKDITIDAKGMNSLGMVGGMFSGNSISNVDLANITISGSSMIGGLLGNLNISVAATIKNITGNNITINGTGSYVGGIVGYQYGTYIEESNISLENSNIYGGSNTGGILGRVYQGKLTHLYILDSEIHGNDGVGGIMGGSEARSTDLREYFQVTSCTIIGNVSEIGGIVGASAFGSNTNWVVYNSVIRAPSVNSQNIGGFMGIGSWSSVGYFEIIDSEIDSGGSKVGGVIGTSFLAIANHGYTGIIHDCLVHGGNDVGGVIGRTSYGSYGRVYVNAIIKSDTSNAGGVIGYMNNTNMTASRYDISVNNTIVLDTTIEAQTNAGGLIGNIAKEIYRDQSFYYNNYIDADVTSTNTSTGSLIIGGRPDENPYIENTYVYRYSTLNGNYVYATNDNVENSQYLVRADLENQSTYSSKIGLGTTYWNYESLSEGKYPMIKDSYLYKPELQIGVDLPTDPEITELNSLSVGDENENNNKANNNTLSNNGIVTQSLEGLPTATVYPVSVNEINIDFSDIPEGVSFTYSVNDEIVESETRENNESTEANSINANELIDLTQKTYTFKYNYQDTLEIKLTNGIDEETITITPDDVRSEASLIGNNNAYLLGTSLYINGELQQGEYVNVYEGYALNSSGQVLELATKQTVTNADDTGKESVDENTDEGSIADTMNNITATENTTANDNMAEANEEVITALQQTTTPLHTYNYNGNTIEVYGTYSIVNNNIKSQIYNVRNGELSAIASNVDMKVGNSIIDNYNDKEYQTILTSNGELIDLKERLQYPDNFLSSNIKQIVQNTDTEKAEMMVLYNTGKAIVFNYVTGNVIYENDEKADEGLVSYLTRSFSNIWSDCEDRGQEYAKGKELEEKLAKLPVEEAMQENNKTENSSSNETSTIRNNNSNTLANVNADTNSTVNNNVSNTIVDSNYITVYNADTGEYEVYSEDEILNGEDENPVSETEKIKENGLEGVYGYDTKEETKPQANGAVIVIAIIAVAIIALVFLRKVIVKNNKKEKNK